MRRLQPWMGAAVLVALGACDQGYGGPGTDAVADLLPEPVLDGMLDTAVDPVVEPTDDPLPEPADDPVVEDPGSTCTYPSGPYAFSAVGDTVGPMSWPSAVVGADETLAADLEALHCDPGVHSVFVQIVTTT